MSLLEKAIGKKRAQRVNEARERARKTFKAKRDAARAAGKEVPTSYKSSETISGGKVVQKSSQVNTDMPKQKNVKSKSSKKSRAENRAAVQRTLKLLKKQKSKY